MYKEHDLIVLTEQAVGDEGEELKPGDVGSIVHVHPGEKAFVVEFMSLDGGTVALATVLASQARSVTRSDLNKIRPYARANCCSANHCSANHALTFTSFVVQAGEPKHGKTSMIEHGGKGVLKNLPQPLRSRPLPLANLASRRRTPSFQVTARSAESSVIMGMRHYEMPIEGVQSHPESILTRRCKDSLQIADCCSWAIFRKYAMGDDNEIVNEVQAHYRIPGSEEAHAACARFEEYLNDNDQVFRDVMDFCR